MSMVIWQQIAQTEYHHQACLHIKRDITPTQGTILDPLLGIVTGTGTGIQVQIPVTFHNYQSHSWNSSHSHRGHSRSYHRCPHRSTSCNHHSSSYHYCCDMPHRRSSTHRSSSTHSRDHSRSRTCTPYKPSKIVSSKPSSSSSRATIKHQDMKHMKVTIYEPQSEYYSSDDASNDSEDDLN